MYMSILIFNMILYEPFDPYFLIKTHMDSHCSREIHPESRIVNSSYKILVEILIFYVKVIESRGLRNPCEIHSFTSCVNLVRIREL